METYLNLKKLERLAEVFANEEQFTEHLKTLWVLRRVVGEKIEMEMGLDIDKANPLYKIFDLTNKLINAIDDGTVSIVNGEVQVDKTCKMER